MQKDFNEKVWNLLSRIPKGRVATYRQIAVALGNPRAARAVGNACGKNPYAGEANFPQAFCRSKKAAPKVPCHRVVKSNGAIGGYSKGSKKKIALLEKEGIKFAKGKIIGFDKKLFSRF